MVGGHEDGAGRRRTGRSGPASRVIPSLVSSRSAGGEVAEGQHDARPDQRHLLVEIRPAGGDLLGQRIAVAGGPALDDVGDVDLARLQAGLLGEQAVEQLAGTTHERPALQVLLPPRPLADHHQVGVRVALAEHHGGPAGGERAAGAGQGDPFDVGEPGHGDPSYRPPALRPPVRGVATVVQSGTRRWSWLWRRA